MIYWQCIPARYSRYFIILSSCLACLILVINDYSLYQLAIMFSLIAIICLESLSHHQRLPVAFSYQRDYWRCYYPHRIVDCQLNRGFVLGPFALLEFRVPDAKTITLGMIYWDITRPEKSQAANWSQLRTVLRYSQKHNNDSNDRWLLG